MSVEEYTNTSRTQNNNQNSPNRLIREQILRNEKAANLMRQMLSLGPSTIKHLHHDSLQKDRLSENKVNTYTIESCDLYDSPDNEVVASSLVDGTDTFQKFDHISCSFPTSTSMISTKTFTLSPIEKRSQTVDLEKQIETDNISNLNMELKLNLPLDDTSIPSSSSPNTGHRYSTSRIRRRSIKNILRRIKKNSSSVEPYSTSGEENICTTRTSDRQRSEIVSSNTNSGPKSYESRFTNRLGEISERRPPIFEIRNKWNDDGRRTHSEHTQMGKYCNENIQIGDKVSKSLSEIEGKRSDELYERCIEINKSYEGSDKTFSMILKKYLTNKEHNYRSNYMKKLNEVEPKETLISDNSLLTKKTCFRNEENVFYVSKTISKQFDRASSSNLMNNDIHREIRLVSMNANEKCGNEALRNCKGDAQKLSMGLEKNETDLLQETIFSRRNMTETTLSERSQSCEQRKMKNNKAENDMPIELFSTFKNRQGGDVTTHSTTSSKTLSRQQMVYTKYKHGAKHETVKLDEIEHKDEHQNFESTNNVNVMPKPIRRYNYDMSIPLIRPLNDFGPSTKIDVEFNIDRHTESNYADEYTGNNSKTIFVRPAVRSDSFSIKDTRIRRRHRLTLHKVPLKVNQSYCSLANLIVPPLRAVYPVLPDVECFLERLKAMQNEFELAKNEYRKFADIKIASSGSGTSVQFYDSELASTSSQDSDKDTFVSQARQLINDPSIMGCNIIRHEPTIELNKKRSQTKNMWFNYDDVEETEKDMYDNEIYLNDNNFLSNSARKTALTDEELQTYKDQVQPCCCLCKLPLWLECLFALFSDQRRYFK